MRIVLLCGGSGRRLWPLSNDIRSKVFLKILKSGDGTRESMIQRICRQLDEVDLLQSACIMTHNSQVEIARKHVGESIPIIGEPYRRGTFTAAALAASYLHEKMQADPNEIVCMLPVDTFADSRFFQLLHRFPEVLSRSKAELALLGTKPKLPSSQYGYIVPELPGQSDEYAVVRRFVEKPERRLAISLMKQCALWNCGVFAFALKFMLVFLKDKGLPAQVENLLACYEQLNVASFDQEVAEHARHAVVMAYDGLWKDLGSWEALSGHFEDKVIGSGRLSDDSVNTHIINELPYPIEVIGASDFIVAAGFDGILIAKKDKANRIKENFVSASQIPMSGEKRWGSFQVYNYWKDGQGRETMIQKVEIAQGKNTSYHQHFKRKEILTVLSGSAEIILDHTLHRLQAGDVLEIPIGAKHGIKAITKLELLEVQLGVGMDTDDIVRLAMNW